MTTLRYPTPEEFALASGRTRRRLHSSYVVDSNGCWRWTRARTTSGYGHFHYRGTYYQAHRFLYGLLRAPVSTTDMDHLCRNRACVNPDHLEPVTRAENVRRSKTTKVTPERVRAIRAAVRRGGSTRAVARLFGVDHSLVSRVMSGQRWADVPDLPEQVTA